MGHAIAGVEGIYDRDEYEDEKADALKKLAGLIDVIIHERLRAPCMGVRYQASRATTCPTFVGINAERRDPYMAPR